MKYHSVLKFLEEATANKMLSLPGSRVPDDLKIIRFADYVTTGIDESYTHEGKNVGQSSSARTRKYELGNYSSHVDICNSCVNNMLAQGGGESLGGKSAFSGATYNSTLVPRIPKEYESSDEDVDSEWDFIEKCKSIMDAMHGVITVPPDSSLSGLFGVENRKYITKGIQFYRASILYGYLTDINAVAAIDNGTTFKINLHAKLINLDPEMKYIDDAIEAKRPLAIKLMDEIYSANPDDFTVTEEGNGSFTNDLKDMLIAYKNTIPQNGDVFLSPREIKEFLPLLEYFRLPEEERNRLGGIYNILAQGMNSLEKKGVHFGDELNAASQIQDIILKGDYDMILAYSQEGDATHSEQFNNKGEEIFVGYITNYAGQEKDDVIPFYISAKDPGVISNLKNTFGTPYHVGRISKSIDVSYKQLNTSGNAKRTGGNEIIFQLPDAMTGYFVSANISKSKRYEQPKDEEKNEPVVAADADMRPIEDETPESSPDVVSQPQVAEKPNTEPVAGKSTVPTTKKQSPMAAIFTKFAKQYVNGDYSREQTVNLIRSKIKNDLGKDISSAAIAGMLDKKYGNAMSSRMVDAEKKIAYNNLFGKKVEKTKLSKASLPLIKELADDGHNFTEKEINNLISRGINQADLDKIVSPAPVMEVRLSRDSYSIKAMLENINRYKGR